MPGDAGGPISLVIVAEVHMSGVTNVNGAGAVMTYKEGPSALMQGMELMTLPPKDTPRADAEKGSMREPTTMKRAKNFVNAGIFSLYTG
jgi:hypothetical protein